MATLPVSASSLLRAPPALSLLLALTYFASAKLGLYFPTHDSHITLFWLPTGMAVAILLRWGSPYMLGGIFLGAFLFDLSLGSAIPLALLSATGNTLTPLAAVWLLKRWRFDPFFTRQYDLLALFAAAGISPLFPAAIGVGTLWLGGLLQPAGMPVAWMNWWLGDMISILLVSPLLLSFNKTSRAELRCCPAELLICVLLLGVAGSFTFLIDFESHVLPLAFLPLPMVLWAALRLGVTGASLAVVTLSAFAAIGTALNKGVFGSLPTDEGMYLAWLYMFITALIGLMATTMQGERKKIEESLLGVNELLHDTQSVARIGSWRLIFPSNILLWSDETYRIFGIPVGTPVTYDSFLGNVHPDDKGKVDTAWQAALRGELYHVQHRIIVNDETRWVEERARLDVDAGGELISGTGSVQDITDSKEARQRIQRSESRYKALLQQAADSMFIHDFKGCILEVNQQACDTLGYSSEELCKMHLGEIAPNFELNVNQPRWELLEPGRPVCFTSTHRRKDGSTFPIEVRLVSLTLDNEKLIMALASDITERRRFETALQESEARYRNFAEQLPLGIVIIQDGLIKYFNPVSVEMTGYAGDELQDRPFLPLVHEEDRNWVQDYYQRRMQGEKVVSPYVVRVVRKDGQIRQLEVHASTLDWKGKPSSIGIMADITERIRLEEKLHNSLRQLEEKELSKTRFLAAAGHDLRQPIAAANLFVDALKLSASSERQLKLIDRLDQSMNVFSNLLERLLDISKFDAGLIRPQYATFDLIELFNWLEQNFAQATLEKRIGLRLHFPMGKSLVVRTDIGLLQSVVMNLVSNAIKFTPHGAILVSARVRGNKVLLQVWDTGCGIAEADLPFIFDEFYQANNPQRNREAGLGLGLSICQRAMSLLGGEVSCRSRLGHGSVFELSIPLNGRPGHLGHITAKTSPVGTFALDTLLHGKRVVVLEDDALVSNGLLNLLQGLGAEALLFADAEAALRHAGTDAADFYIVDFALSGELTGIDFLNTVQREHHAPIRSVIITGETSSGFISSTRDIPWPVLHKPVNLSKLLSTLNQQIVH
ncbi:MAG: PAS domain S-box protein [Sideroxyarcus sp.]|nr:PAS domain S-box protein [Sideroxyarcus sp.]